jgi:glycosyltransferase involved in cell wall biosynthesis
VLDRCTDGSRAVAERFGATILEGAWEIEGDRRNVGIAACTGTWIIELDADERIQPALAEALRARLPGAPPGYFLVRFDNYIGERLIRHGWGAYNGIARKPCVFSPGAKVWGRERVHPRLELSGVRGELDGAITHYVDRDVADMIARLNRYTTLAALDAVESGTVMPRSAALRRVFSRFWKSYVARRGYREGPWGLALGLFSALYPLLTYIKAETLRRR